MHSYSPHFQSPIQLETGYPLPKMRQWIKWLGVGKRHRMVSGKAFALLTKGEDDSLLIFCITSTMARAVTAIVRPYGKNKSIAWVLAPTPLNPWINISNHLLPRFLKHEKSKPWFIKSTLVWFSITFRQRHFQFIQDTRTCTHTSTHWRTKQALKYIHQSVNSDRLMLKCSEVSSLYVPVLPWHCYDK